MIYLNLCVYNIEKGTFVSVFGSDFIQTKEGTPQKERNRIGTSYYM